jgi:hypothetical protein
MPRTHCYGGMALFLVPVYLVHTVIDYGFCVLLFLYLHMCFILVSRFLWYNYRQNIGTLCVYDGFRLG